MSMFSGTPLGALQVLSEGKRDASGCAASEKARLRSDFALKAPAVAPMAKALGTVERTCHCFVPGMSQVGRALTEQTFSHLLTGMMHGSSKLDSSAQSLLTTTPLG